MSNLKNSPLVRTFALFLAFSLGLSLLLGFLHQPPRALAAAFTPGNLVVVQVGDGIGSLGTMATPVFLNEYTTSGSLVQTLALPTSVSGSNRRLTSSGTATSEGNLSLSSDGQYLSLAGYDASPGTANVAASTVTATNRVVARVDSTGTINTSTAIIDAYSANNIRSAVTNNGNQFWVGGADSTNGTRYVPLGNTGPSTGISTASANVRVVNIYNGQLYLSTGSGTTKGVFSVGAGLPTTSGQTASLLGGSSTLSPYSFLLLDRDSSVPGPDTLYIADSGTGTGFLKYSFDGATWTARGNVSVPSNNLTGVTGVISGTSVVLYGTSPNSLFTLTDSAAFNSNLTGTVTNLKNAPPSTTFRGLAFAPQIAGVAPTITTHPASQTVPYGGSATISVTASGTVPLSYQWYQGGSPTTGTLISGATNSSYTTPALTATQTYSVRVTNTFGSANSNVATITVSSNNPPQISSIPALTNAIGDPTNPGVSLVVSDTETPAASLTLTATATNNASVAPLSNVTITSGVGGQRLVTITPAGEGYADITLSVSDSTTAVTGTLHYAASAQSTTQNTTRTRYHSGTGDASSAISVDSNYMFVADDENQVLRLYDRNNSGLPVAGFDFTSDLGISGNIDPSTGLPYEVDLEGSTQVGSRIYWIGSHSNSKTGKLRPNRYRLFATDLNSNGVSSTLSYVGRYDNLRTDLINWDHNNGHGKGADYYGFQDGAAQGVAPEVPTKNGFNIEGLEMAPGSTTTAYIAFRAPIIPSNNRVRALIVPVTNFADLVSGNPSAGPAQFGVPIELALGGRGIREIRKNAADQYVILAGSPTSDSTTAPNDPRIYTWTGQPGDLPVLRSADLPALGVQGGFEGVADLPANLTDSSQLQVLVDSGDAVWYNDGLTDKDLTEPNFKKFRSDIVTLGAPTTIPTTITLVSTPNPSTYGQSVVFTATVSPFADAGVITLTEGANVLGSADVINSSAVFTLSNLSAGSHSITASYGGDNTYGSGTSSAVSQVVNQANTSLSLVSAPNPSTYDQSATFTATVSPLTATGTVTFSTVPTGTVLGTANLNNGEAVLTLPANSLPVGDTSLQASYGGDPNYTSSTSNTLTQIVKSLATTLALSSAPNPASADQAVVFTATVSPVAASGVVTFSTTPTGTVLGTANLSNGTAIITVTAGTLPVGMTAVQASYDGDSSYNGSLSNVVNQQITALSTTLTLSSTPNPAAYTQNIVFTAMVSPMVASGTVTFSTTPTGTVLGMASLVNGVATFTVTAGTLPVGTKAVQAVYGGDATYTGSTSNPVNQQVTAQSSSLTLTSAPNPAIYAQNVVFTATVSPVTASGTVTFSTTPTSTLLGTAPLSNGVAVITVTAGTLPVGMTAVQASYGGDASHTGNVSNVVNQQVTALTSTLSLTSGPDPSSFVQDVVFTATVSPIAASGTVTFSTTPTGTMLGTAQLNNGVVVITVTAGTLPIGSTQVQAAYGGDTTHSGSISNIVTQVVTTVPTTLTLTSDPNPSTYGQNVVFTATLSSLAASGPVTFTEGTTVLGTASVVSGQAVFNTSVLSAGSHLITATYGGNATYAASTSSNLTQVVNQAVTSLTLTSDLNPSTYGQNVVFTATVSPLTASGPVTLSTVPTGTILGATNLVSGTAVFTVSTLPIGLTNLKAVYGGNANYLGSQSNQVAQMVNSPILNCDPYLVTSATDDGSGLTCGTLSFAISRAVTATTDVSITFTSTVTAITIGSKLPDIHNTNGHTISLDGGCTPDGNGRGEPGVQLIGSNSITVGLTLAGNANLSGVKLTGFGGYGVEIGGSGNSLSCSWIGTANGTTASPNAGGVHFLPGATNNRLGQSGASATSKGNLIGGNTGSGIVSEGGPGNSLYANWIGLGQDGLSHLRNGGPAVQVSPTAGRLVFGPGNRLNAAL